MTNYDLSNLVAELKVSRMPVPGRESNRGGRAPTTSEFPSSIREGMSAETVLSIGDESIERGRCLKNPSNCSQTRKKCRQQEESGTQSSKYLRNSKEALPVSVSRLLGGALPSASPRTVPSPTREVGH
jgi:hypothetical protein